MTGRSTGRSEPARAHAAWPADPVLVPIVLVALALRLGLLWSLHHSVYGDFLLWDEQTYQAWASALISGNRYGLPDQSALPAYLMAIAYRFMGTNPLVARGLNVALGTLTCIPMYLLGRSLAGRAVGIASAVCCAVYLPFVFLSVTLLKEPLGLLLFSTVLWLFVTSLRDARPALPRLALLGTVAALAVEVRQNAILPVAAIPVLLAIRFYLRDRSVRRPLLAAAIVGIAYLAVTAPLVLARRQQAGGVSATPVGGFNLYLGNYLPSGVPFYRPVPFASSNPQEHAIQFTIEASRRAGRRLTPGEASSFWTREVLRTAWEQPGPFARRLGLKLLAVLNRWEEADNHSIDFFSRYVSFLRIPLPGYGLALPLGMAGLILLVLADARVRALGVLLALYVLTMVVVFPNMRVRLPIVLVLLPCAAAAVARIWERRDRRMAAWFMGLTAVFGAVELAPIPGAGDMTAHLNTHAINLLMHGREDEARKYWQQSADLHGSYSVYALESLAFDRLSRGDAAAARALLERVPEDSFAASEKHEKLADSWMASGDPVRAREELERSLRINWGSRRVHAKLLSVLERLDPDRAAEERRTLEYVGSFYPP